jgi:galactitol PTS system EIIA component
MYEVESRGKTNYVRGGVVLLLKTNLIRMDCEAETKEDVIQALVNLLVQYDIVENEYYNDVIEREKEFPTGLPTNKVKVAIPHANPKHILQSGMAIAVLKKPVMFHNLEKPEELLPVSLVFLLANKENSEQIKGLEMLMNCFSEDEVLEKIANSKKADEVIEAIRSVYTDSN